MHLDSIISRVRLLFSKAVSSVNPHNLIERNVEKLQHEGQDFLSVGGREYSLKRNCYVVGFGKAVLGMARSLENVMGQYIKAGVLSIPEGTRAVNPNMFIGPYEKSRLLILEGARNNLPDKNSEMAAMKIAELVRGLDSDNVLIVLISGGGSALLPLPVSTVSLEEKLSVIKLLSKAGADIGDLNCVRRRLSQLKGGGLARLAYPAQVISLIISDVIGDPIDTIASGPTYPSTDSPQLAWQVVQKYGHDVDVPVSVVKCLTSTEEIEDTHEFNNVNNLIIGSNAIALTAVNNEARDFGFISLIMSDKIQGVVQKLARAYSSLATNICHFWLSQYTLEEFNSKFDAITNDYRIDISHVQLSQAVTSSRDSQKPLCLILGGEPTVIVTGDGVGGRNQELALYFACAMQDNSEKDPELKTFDVVLLSAGTDGIDGPTDVAGAVGHRNLIEQAKTQLLDPKSFLQNNDSYNFFAQLNHGESFIKTGHTGTNVMDIHILVIALKCHCFNER